MLCCAECKYLHYDNGKAAGLIVSFMVVLYSIKAYRVEEKALKIFKELAWRVYAGTGAGVREIIAALKKNHAMRL
jgi:hypothetical protein